MGDFDTSRFLPYARLPPLRVRPFLGVGECLYLVAGEPVRRGRWLASRRRAAPRPARTLILDYLDGNLASGASARTPWIANTPTSRSLLANRATCWCALRSGPIVFACASPGAAGGWSNGDTWEDFGGEVTHFAIVHLPGLPA